MIRDLATLHPTLSGGMFGRRAFQEQGAPTLRLRFAKILTFSAMTPPQGSGQEGQTIMSMPDYDAGCYDDHDHPQVTVHRVPRAWQRINTVRKQQGVSLRKVARRLQTDVRTLRHEEDETTDLPISRLYEWQQVLEVPVSELLIDSEAPLSSPVQDRAKLVRVMKTVGAILERAKDPCVRRMAENLSEMLVEMMPELKEVGAWHSVGQRRTLDEMGRIVERAYSEEVFRSQT